MFLDFSDREFAIVLISVDGYSLGCVNLVNTAKDKGVPLDIVSSFVNIQRRQYNLPESHHMEYRDILLDTVVSGNTYFSGSENLRLALATLVSAFDEGSKEIDGEYICRIIRGVEKFLSFKINYSFDIDEYCKALINHK